MLVAAAPQAVAEPVDFVRDVRPLLERSCYACHGEEEQHSGLRLDIKQAAFAGGDFYGASIVAGQPAASPLWQFVADPDADMQMPPEGEAEPLTEAEAKTLAQWIREGAVWPDGIDAHVLAEREEHWAFAAPRLTRLPQPAASQWAKNPLDLFILQRLEAAQLSPSEEAGQLEWLRRVSFDLTGLPPTPADVRDFLSDHHSSADDSYAKERVVERLLNSPHYGERWAQHWLDVVRYADTHGFEVNTERPHAWPYRDYVIQALNQDLPYDDFICQQIVGDALGTDAATGFLVTASVLLPGQIGKDAPSIRLARQDAIDEIVNNIGQTFLGLSIGCARCHNHKFDPITQREYYAMQTFVAGVEYEDRPLESAEAKQRRAQLQDWRNRLSEIQFLLTQFAPLANVDSEQALRGPVNARQNVDRFQPVATDRLRFTISATNNLEPCIDELEVFNVQGSNVALQQSMATVTSSGNTTVPNRHELRLINNGEYGNSSSWMSNEPGAGWVEIQFAKAETIDRVIWGRDREGTYADRLATAYEIEIATPEGGWQLVASSGDRQPLGGASAEPLQWTTDGLTEDQATQYRELINEQQRLQRAVSEATQEKLVFAGKFRTPDEIRLLRRGDPEQPQELVSPAVPAAIGRLDLAEGAAEQERRFALAEWIASPENPLTARVMVNRVWQGHFGVGLVDTPNDFGRNGTSPSHPELLDWLAIEFINGGWSLKHLHRLIVLSATYQQASLPRPEGLRIDADNRFLWRFSPRRLSGEAIRDSILMVSGKLNLAKGGPGYSLFNQRGGLSGFVPVEQFAADGHKRMIYAHRVRRERDAVFGAFDCPDAGQSTAQRRESTTPLQALNLFNSRFVIDHSQDFAERVLRDAGIEPAAQIRVAYELAVGRTPTAEEIAIALPVVTDHGLDALCRALFNCNEFLFIP